MAIALPKTEEDFRALSDADLEDTRNFLTAEADKLRNLRRAFAREAERRAALPKAQAAAHDITAAGGIEGEGT